MRPLYLLGRAIFGGYFLYNGINHFVNREMMSQYAGAKGVAAPDAAVAASGAMLVAGGLSILTGLKPRQGLAAIVGFLIPVSLQMHRFWEEPDDQRRMAEMINFTKNMALVGASLMLLQLEHPWPVSVDEARADDEEMFVRLGGRDLRALPA
ncbi:MAG TPA: DoxX family protein [Vicinamibacterales bacterium]|nr:DoxX family protein [Vicinamibacterales bacterium]